MFSSSISGPKPRETRKNKRYRRRCSRESRQEPFLLFDRTRSCKNAISRQNIVKGTTDWIWFASLLFSFYQPVVIALLTKGQATPKADPIKSKWKKPAWFPGCHMPCHKLQCVALFQKNLILKRSNLFLEALWWEISSNHNVMLGYFINCQSVNFAKVFVKFVSQSSPQGWNLSRPSRTAVAIPHICLFWYTTALVEPVYSTPESA